MVVVVRDDLQLPVHGAAVQALLLGHGFVVAMQHVSRTFMPRCSFMHACMHAACMCAYMCVAIISKAVDPVGMGTATASTAAKMAGSHHGVCGVWNNLVVPHSRTHQCALGPAVWCCHGVPPA